MSDFNPAAPSVYPFLRYQDCPKAMDFLKRAFGFQEVACYEGPAGTIAHAELSLGPCIIMVGSSRSESVPARPEVIEKVESGLYIAVPDVDAHYAMAKAAGARIARELENTDYGAREYAAFDTDGFWWSFGDFQPKVGQERDSE